MKTPDILHAMKPVRISFDKLSIPYYISGSIASSVYGIARATMDIDLVADIKHENVFQLKKMLEDKYYIDENMIEDAIKHSSSFNLIHLETMIKIDVFIQKKHPYHIEALKRKRKDTLEESANAPEFYFSSPEDIILNKLQWYNEGDRVSEREWLDVIGVIKVQSNNLDTEYLQKWGDNLGLSELITKAFEDAGISI